MISLARIAVVCLGLFLVSGCGPGSTPVEQPETTTADLIRQDLQYPAESGQPGSELVSVEANLEKLQEEDPALAAELKEDLEELKGLSGPRAKNKAQEMIEKLE